MKIINKKSEKSLIDQFIKDLKKDISRKKKQKKELDFCFLKRATKYPAKNALQTRHAHSVAVGCARSLDSACGLLQPFFVCEGLACVDTDTDTDHDTHTGAQIHRHIDTDTDVGARLPSV